MQWYAPVHKLFCLLGSTSGTQVQHEECWICRLAGHRRVYQVRVRGTTKRRGSRPGVLAPFCLPIFRALCGGGRMPLW